MIKEIFIGLFILVGFSVLVVFYASESFESYSYMYRRKEAYIKSSKYLVNSLKCKILDIDPFDSQVSGFYSRETYKSCTDKKLLTYVTKNEYMTTLHVNPVKKDISCCYNTVSRKPNDFTVGYSSCFNFKDNVTIEDDTIQVICKADNRIFYTNTHAPVRLKKNIMEKIDNMKEKNLAYSVLILGIDSISRLNFIRTLPSSYKFLMDNEWISFRGYNKIADNTFPNVMAILTGFNEALSYSKCKPRETSGLNQCPMIWYDYRNLGYATAYAEDECPLSTFNLDKKGFKDPPTDYYFRPYFLASERLHIAKLHNLNYCTGPETSGERVLNVAKDFATTFLNKPNFGLFWMNTFSHNNLNSPGTMDEKIHQFLQDISNAGVLENSVVIFLSDHGARFGGFRDSSMGWLEERLPFFFLWVPHKFRRTFPLEFFNVVENADHKLTNPYDLYMTLQHLLVLSGFEYRTKESVACPKCRSLFSDVDSDRSCEDAAIPQHWCTCQDFSPIDEKDQGVRDAAIYVIDQIHNTIHATRGDYICAKYSLHKIIAASISGNVSYKKEKYILIVIETQPKAVFEVTLSYQANATQRFKLRGGISRIDSYEPNSHCCQNSILKKYCYCKN